MSDTSKQRNLPMWKLELELYVSAERHEDAMEEAADLLDHAAGLSNYLGGSAHVPKEPVEDEDA